MAWSFSSEAASGSAITTRGALQAVGLGDHGGTTFGMDMGPLVVEQAGASLAKAFPVPNRKQLYCNGLKNYCGGGDAAASGRSCRYPADCAGTSGQNQRVRSAPAAFDASPAATASPADHHRIGTDLLRRSGDVWRLVVGGDDDGARCLHLALEWG